MWVDVRFSTSVSMGSFRTHHSNLTHPREGISSFLHQPHTHILWAGRSLYSLLSTLYSLLNTTCVSWYQSPAVPLVVLIVRHLLSSLEDPVSRIDAFPTIAIAPTGHKLPAPWHECGKGGNMCGNQQLVIGGWRFKHLRIFGAVGNVALFHDEVDRRL